MEKKTWFPEVKLVSRKTTSNSRDRWDSLKRGYAPQIPRLEPLRLSKWGTGSREITRKTVSKKGSKDRKKAQTPSKSKFSLEFQFLPAVPLGCRQNAEIQRETLESTEFT